MNVPVSHGQRIGFPLLTRLLALATILALTATTPRGGAQASTPETSDQGFVGAWRLVFETPVGPSQSLLTVMADGTLIFSGQTVKPESANAPVTFISAGHGVWQLSEINTAEMTWIGMVSDGEGTLLALATDSARVTLAADGNSWHGAYRATVTDPQGNVLFEGNGMLSATRITVEPLGTPEAGGTATPIP